MNNYADVSFQFKTLGDESRLRILSMLISGEKCACKLLDELQITQPTLSHHMRILAASGLVRTRKEGKWRHYTIIPAAMQNLRAFLTELANADVKSPC